ncbi:MAG: acyl-CoA thioesterase II [Rhizobiales bacterium]|nr:acyl-CoA thioesterase II [Hyphomicrobiales bacterium]NRB15180.1 acyl-CoA thioesterase II [Hyphomicrobiales bacterium]
MNPALETLINTTLKLEKIEHLIFRGISPQNGWQRVFGGQVIGQALVAARHTVKAMQFENDRLTHSLHGYFLRAGDPSVPIVYEVDPVRDGKSFSTRRVVAIQHGKAIFSMIASFQKHEHGLTHQIDMPDVPLPDTLPSEAELKAKYLDKLPKNMQIYWSRERPIEMRHVESRYISANASKKPAQNVWFRASSKLPDDVDIHQAVLAFASDFSLLDTSLIAHGTSIFDPKMQVASLDHAIWFHRPFKADDWLLYSQDSPSSSGARGFNRGSIFNLNGELVASTAQEGLIRDHS